MIIIKTARVRNYKMNLKRNDFLKFMQRSCFFASIPIVLEIRYKSDKANYLNTSLTAICCLLSIILFISILCYFFCCFLLGFFSLMQTIRLHFNRFWSLVSPFQYLPLFYGTYIFFQHIVKNIKNYIKAV